MVTDQIMKGVVSLEEGNWISLDSKGRCNSGAINIITSSRASSGLSQATTANTCIASLKKCLDAEGENRAYEPPAVIHRAGKLGLNVAAMKLTERAQKIKGATMATMGPGEKLFYERCTLCHVPREPGDYTKKQWHGITQSMFTSLFPSNGAVDTALRQKVDMDFRPLWSYQQAVLSMGSEIWISGSQHDTQVYRASDFSLIRNFGSVPWGDGQAIATTGGRVYVGNHAPDNTLMYSDPPAPLWTDRGWNTRGATSSAPIHWIGSWDAGGNHRFIAEWYPQVGTQYGEGAWELFVDSVGCLWAGGDFNRGSFDGNVARYVGGFAKFCPGDGIAPTVPTGVDVSLRAGGIQLVWPASTDERPGPITYDIFRDDTLIATGLTNRTYLDPSGVSGSRYFIRAVDQAGNRSATTSVLHPADTSKPTTPQNLQAVIQATSATLTWNAATDNVAVTAYAVYRNGVELFQVTDLTATVDNLSPGDHYLQVQAIDAAGNRGFKTSPIKVTTV